MSNSTTPTQWLRSNRRQDRFKWGNYASQIRARLDLPPPGRGCNVPTPDSPNVPTPDVPDVLTLAEATVQCTLDGYVDNPLQNDDAFDKCVKEYTS